MPTKHKSVNLRTLVISFSMQVLLFTANWKPGNARFGKLVVIFCSFGKFLLAWRWLASVHLCLSRVQLCVKWKARSFLSLNLYDWLQSFLHAKEKGLIISKSNLSFCAANQVNIFIRMTNYKDPRRWSHSGPVWSFW